MENNKKHVPDYEISTYGEGFFTYTGNSTNSIDALKEIHRNRTNQGSEKPKGGSNGQDNRTDK